MHVPTSHDLSSTDGGCLCGGVRFRIHGALRDVLTCHCRMCQNRHTLAGAYTACPPEALDMIESAALRWYRSAIGFCSLCGSGLFWKPEHGRHVSIAAGSLDDPRKLGFGGHIFAEEKAAYA